MVYMQFGFTMMTLLIKSRFFNIGSDISYQFEPDYMSHMVNKIISNVDFDVKEKKRSHMETRARLIDRINYVDIGGVDLKIKLNAEAF